MMTYTPETESLNRQTESHRWVSETDHNGNAWSDEQVAILNHIAVCVETDQPIRVAIDAVAGSGKTTVLRGILVLLSNAQNESASNHMSLSPMAFNASIAAVLADTMNAVKPDGADWVSKGTGTLNGHGLRTVRKAFSHDIKLTKAKYTMLSRWAVMEMLGDPLILAEFDASTPITDSGNKRYQSAWFGLCRFVKNITEKAMGYGLFVDSAVDYADAWSEFLRINRASFRITDVAMGPMIEDTLPLLVQRIITTGMSMVADPTVEISLSDTAVAYFKPDRYTTIMSPVADMNPQWRDGLGAEHRPTLKTTTAGCDGSINRYRTGGRFAHNRIHISLPYVDDIKALNTAIKNASWSAKFGHANSHRDSDRYGVRPADCDDLWVRSIKDTPECISGLIATVQRVCGIDLSPLFGASSQVTEEQTTATALVAHIDCIYAPIYMGLNPWRTFDLVLADEVQDMSKLQGAFMRTLMCEGGNAVVVGDPKQSLYLFSGASSQSMSENIDALDCAVFPMTYCYRLTATLSREVRLLMGADEDGNTLPYLNHRHPEYIASWPVGERSSTIPHNALTDRVQLGDMVLCRIGSPLVGPAMRCLREGIPVRIAGGGDLEKGVRSVCDTIGIAGQRPADLTTKIEAYLHDDVSGVLAKLMRSKAHKGDEASARKDDQYIKATHLTDAISALVRRWTACDTDLDFCAVGDAPQDWLADLFCDPNADGSGFVMFSSVHRAKGLEARRVFIIADRLTMSEDGEEKISPTFMLPWSMNNDAEIEQERNAVYVAITRAMKSNTFVSHDGGASFFAAIGGQETAEMFLSYLSGDDMDEAVHEDDDDTDEAVVESDAENAPAEDETTPTPTDGAEDDLEAAQDAKTHEFAMVIHYPATGHICCDHPTESPAEAQAWLEKHAQSFTTPYDGGTWLDGANTNKGMAEQVAVFALWMDCPVEVLNAVADPESTWCKCIAFTINADCPIHGHMADDDDDGDAVSTDGAEDGSESTQDATTHEFAMVTYIQNIGVECDGITDSPAEAQAFLEQFAKSFTTPYDNGTWLDADVFAHPDRPDEVAVFPLWMDCPAEVLLAVSDYRDYDNGDTDDADDDDTDDDGDAVSTDEDPTDGGEAPTTARCAECLLHTDDAVPREPHGMTMCNECFWAEPQDDDDDSTVDDEPQADVHPQALGCSWGDAMTYLATPTTFVRSMENDYADRSRVKPAKRADDLLNMVGHALECDVCREDIRTRCGRIPLSPESIIDDSSIAPLMNTTDGTIRRVLDLIADSTDQDHTTFSGGEDTGAWTILPLVNDERGVVYASCLRTPNGRIQRNTRVEFSFNVPTVSALTPQAVEETDDTTTVDDEPQGNLCITWADTTTPHMTMVGDCAHAFIMSQRVTKGDRGASLIAMIEHAVDCVACREVMECHGNRIGVINDASIASIQNTTVSTIRRVLDHLADSTPGAPYSGCWTDLTLARDEAGEQSAYASCLRTDSDKIQRNTDVEIWFTKTKADISALSVPHEPRAIEETDDTTTVEAIVEAIEETKGAFERVFAVDVDDSPQPVEEQPVDVNLAVNLHYTAPAGVELTPEYLAMVERAINYGFGKFIETVAPKGVGGLDITVEPVVDDSPQPAEDTDYDPTGYHSFTDIHGYGRTLRPLTDDEREAFRTMNSNAPMPSHFCGSDGVAVHHSSRDNFAYHTGLSYCEMKPRLMLQSTSGSHDYGTEYAVWLFNDAESDEDTERIQGIINDITNTQEDE